VQRPQRTICVLQVPAFSRSPKRGIAHEWRGAADPRPEARPPAPRHVLLPSLFTVGNIGAGYFAIIQTIAAIGADADAHTHLDWAALAILLAIPFDSLDGRIARMTNTTSEFGKELDSLADVITFGVAPSLLAYIWCLSFPAGIHKPRAAAGPAACWRFLCFLFLIGGASRLARFNISHNPQPRNPGRPDRKYFVGMPIPCGGSNSRRHRALLRRLSQPGIVDCRYLHRTSGHLRFPHGEHLAILVGQGDQSFRRHRSQTLLFLAIILFAIIRFSQGVLFAAVLLYMFSGIWARAAYSWSRRRRRRPGSPLDSSDPVSPSQPLL